MADEFKTTRWSLIVAANGADDRASEALSGLCQAYWRPVYAFVRRRGHSVDDAADLTQAFFTHLLEQRAFARADQSRGRFRSYLLAAAHNFLAGARLHALTERRGGRARHDSLDAYDGERAPVLTTHDQESSPDLVFERHWALNITERALERVRAEYAARGQERAFDALRPLLTSHGSPSADGGEPRAEVPGDAAHRTALSRARRRLGEALRSEIRDTLNDGDDLDDELRFLLRVLTG